MSTRAAFTFTDADDTFHVYQQCDGYPSEAAKAIRRAMESAWELPRFEAAEFAAAFVASNKRGPGGVYLTTHHEHWIDLEYRYEVSTLAVAGNMLTVTAYKCRTGTGDQWHERTDSPIFVGFLDDFEQLADKMDDAD